MSGIIGGAGSRSGVIGTTELDYEEGLFDVTTSSESSGSPAITGSPAYMRGSYVKIGNMVTINFSDHNVAMEDGSIIFKNSTNPIYFRGMPFAAGKTKDGDLHWPGSSNFTWINQQSDVVVPLIEESQTYCVLARNGNNSTQQWTKCNDLVHNGTDIAVTITYLTTTATV